MTPQKLEQKVWALINEHRNEMNKKDFHSFLCELRDSINTRAEIISEIMDKDTLEDNLKRVYQAM